MKQQLLIIAIVAHTALWHNNKHYPVGAEIELPEAEFNALAYYLVRKDEESTSTEQSDTVDIAAEAKSIADEMDAATQAEATDAPAEEKKGKGKKAR